MYAAAEKSDVIGPEGMEKFCEDIGVEPENVCRVCIVVVVSASVCCADLQSTSQLITIK